MLALLGAGPDPKTMTCEAIIKGYEKNKQLASSRSGKHAKNAMARVKELEAYYQSCKVKGATAPVEQQATEIQAVMDQIYGSSSGPYTMSAGVGVPGGGTGIDLKKILIMAAVGGIGLFLVVKVLKKRGE